MDLKDSKTVKNLMVAFAGESQAKLNIITMQIKQKKKDIIR